jgi:hypothetical protein
VGMSTAACVRATLVPSSRPPTASTGRT